MSYGPRAGKNSSVQIGTTPLYQSRFDVNDQGDDLDTTTFENNGYETGLIGIEVAQWSFGGNYNADASPYNNPPGIFPRSDLANLNLYTNVADIQVWNFPEARVLSAKNSSEYKGLVKFDASGKSNGAFTQPG